MSRHDKWKLGSPPRFEGDDGHPVGEPDPPTDDNDDDEPLEPTPLVNDDDPDEYISDDPDHYQEFGGES